MTEEQIIKALECCINNNCGSCPDSIANSVGNCERNLRRDALDFINRQNAEIEQKDVVIKGLEKALTNVTVEADRLLKESESKEQAYNNEFNLRKELKAEIEQWKEEANKYQTLWCEAVKDIQTAKSEAIKEFAEKFGSLFAAFDDYDTLHVYEIKDRIDFVKEMVGG